MAPAVCQDCTRCRTPSLPVLRPTGSLCSRPQRRSRMGLLDGWPMVAGLLGSPSPSLLLSRGQRRHRLWRRLRCIGLWRRSREGLRPLLDQPRNHRSAAAHPAYGSDRPRLLRRLSLQRTLVAELHAQSCGLFASLNNGVRVGQQRIAQREAHGRQRQLPVEGGHGAGQGALRTGRACARR